MSENMIKLYRNGITIFRKEGSRDLATAKANGYVEVTDELIAEQLAKLGQGQEPGEPDVPIKTPEKPADKKASKAKEGDK